MSHKIIAYKALSDAYGKIDQVLISMSTGGDAEVENRYRGILTALGARVHFIFIGQYDPGNKHSAPDQSRQVGSLKRLIGKEKSFQEHQLYIMEPDFEFGNRPVDLTPWIADPFTILKGPSGAPILLEPYYFGKEYRGQDRHIAEQVSAYTDFLLKSTRYEFEGGNVLVGDDFMLVGRDALEANLRRYYRYMNRQDATHDKAVQRITERFGSTFGLPFVIWIGQESPFTLPIPKGLQGDGRTQIFYHIDLYLTLGGKTTSGEELVYLAEISDHEFALLENMPQVVEDWRKVAEALERVKEMLETRHLKFPGPKFKVARLPMGFRKLDSGKIVPLSMNNCLVEIYNGLKFMYLPKYESPHPKDSTYLDKLMERTESAVKKHSFHPIWVEGNFFDIAPTYGSLHCTVKVLRRSGRTY